MLNGLIHLSLRGYFRDCFQSICCIISTDIDMSLGPWIIWYLTHRSIWQHRGVVNSQRAFALIMKGGAGLSPKCQHSYRFRYSRSLWESQSQHLLTQPLSIYLFSGEYIPCVTSLFYNNQFWTNRKKKGASHNEWLELHTSHTVPAACLPLGLVFCGV